MKFYLAIFVIIAVALSGCQDYYNPVGSGSGSTKIKVESKYVVDVSNSNISNLLYKKFYDINGNITQYEEFSSSGLLVTQSMFSYKDLVSREEIKTYDADGNLSNSCVVVSQYYDNGKIKERQTLSDDGKVSSKETYSYDSNWNLLLKTNCDLISNTQNSIEYSYKYNNSGALIERTINEIGKSGTHYSRDSIAYRQQDNSLEIMNYDASGDLSKIKTFYYNQNGLVSLEIESNEKGQITSKYAYRYEFYK